VREPSAKPMAPPATTAATTTPERRKERDADDCASAAVGCAATVDMEDLLSDAEANLGRENLRPRGLTDR